jgi:hypothetical protein
MAAKKGNKYAEGNKGGCPLKCTPEVVAKVKEYVDGGWRAEDVIPQKYGLSEYVGVALNTLENWYKNKVDEEFLILYERVMPKQARELINGGLKGDFNPAITKMLLAKHGYSDKVETEISGGLSVATRPLSPQEAEAVLKGIQDV